MARLLTNPPLHKRRLSKDIIKQSGRQIAKVVHSNPVVSFTYIIRQIKSYDNMIPHIIDATRYLTDLEFDIFAYCITEALASETSSRWEGNDITIASWLKYLASFTGRLYRKHPIDLSGILMYIMSQLLKGNIYELIVLQELIGHMSGIKPLDEITHSQLDSLSGGETLKREVFFYENSKAVKKSSSRLSKALIDTGLAAKFALIIAQLRQRLTSHDPGDEYEKPQKTVIWLSDFCGKALIQYLDFMSSDLSPAAYRLAFPSFETLVGEYSLDTEYAFAISRPTLSYQLQYQNSNGTIGNNDSKQRCIDTVFKMLPGEVWEGISPDFYFEFWRLSSRDFFCPTALYNSEIRDHQKMKKSIEAELAACSTGASKFNKKIEKVSSLIRTLDSERTAQENHNKSVLEYIRKESKSWFSKSVGHNETINAMIQHCLYPRCIFSPSDAVYTAKFILLMHSLGVPNIATISLYDRLLNGDIFHAMIFSSSEDEAKSYGLFLSHTFDTLSSWRKFPELFEKEAIGVDLPGFLKKWPLKSDQNSQPNFSTAEYILHNEFRQAMRKWHLKMFRAITYCLRSNEYVRIRNSLLVLDKLSDHFPITKEMGKHLEHCVLEIEKNETREDLKQLARSYYSKMQIKKHIWVNTSDFCHLATQKPPPGDQGDSAKRSNPPAPSTPASAKPPEGSLQDNRNSGAESPLVSVLAPIDAATRNAREVNRTISVSPQHRDINSDKAVSSASSTRFSQGSRPTEKKYQAVHSSSAKENWTDSLKEEGVSSRKQTAEPAMDYSGSEKEAVMTRQAMSLEVPRSRHIHKLPSEIKDKSNVEMQLSREEPALELSQSDRKQEHPKITRNITKEHKGNRPQVIEGAERQVHHLTRYEAHGSQSDKDPYPGRLANIDYYQKRSAGEDTSIIMRNGGSHRFPIHGPRSSPSLQSPTVQAATSAHLRVQELPAIDIVSGHQPRNMNLFIMRHHNIWPRAEDGNIQQVYHNKPLKIARTTSASAAQSLPFAQSSQRTKDPSEMTSPSKKCPEDAICEDPSSKEYKSHDKDKKKIRSVERSRYSRKRKDRESDQLNAGNQDKRTSEKKPVRRYSKTYSSNFEDDPRAAPIERRDRKSHDKDPGRPAQSSTGSANVPEDIHHSPCSNHQNARGSFHHQEFQ